MPCASPRPSWDWPKYFPPSVGGVLPVRLGPCFTSDAIAVSGGWAVAAPAGAAVTAEGMGRTGVQILFPQVVANISC